MGGSSVRLLLDTHTILWWWTNDSQLSSEARGAIADERNQIMVSAATAWELGIKQRIGKLANIPPIAERYAGLLAADGFLALPMTHQHALRAAGFEHPHRDPFDRMLAAQSALERLTLVTRDSAFIGFPCTTLW